MTARPDDFAGMLTVTRLDLSLAADPRLEIGFDLVARLRGAWGHSLRRAALAGDAGSARARELFFPDKTGAAGHATPPYRIAARTDRNRLRVTLALIGFAGCWRDAAFDSMVAALTAEPGLRLDHRSGRHAPLRLLSADWTRTEGIDLPPLARHLILDFQTPLCIGPSGVLGTSFDDILVGLAERAAITARWIGLQFEPRLSWWRDRARALNYDCGGLKPVVWDMYSSVNGRVKAAGYAGRLVVSGADDEVLALLATGTVLHAGGAPSKGFGRYDLCPCPW